MLKFAELTTACNDVPNVLISSFFSSLAGRYLLGITLGRPAVALQNFTSSVQVEGACSAHHRKSALFLVGGRLSCSASLAIWRRG